MPYAFNPKRTRLMIKRGHALVRQPRRMIARADKFKGCRMFTYGRGSRTLAPDGLWREDGRGHGCKAGPAEMSIPACVNLVRIVESFNAYVQSWCEGVPALWAEHCDNEDTEALAAKHKASAQKARETRERNAWACRGMVTV